MTLKVKLVAFDTFQSRERMGNSSKSHEDELIIHVRRILVNQVGTSLCNSNFNKLRWYI